MSRKRIPLNQNGCTANFRIGVPFEQNLQVGNDFFGDQLRAAIKEAGIDDIGLCTDEKIHTTLAMVHTYPDGDRDFSFYRNLGADMMLNKTEISEDILKETEMQISKKL